MGTQFCFRWVLGDNPLRPSDLAPKSNFATFGIAALPPPGEWWHPPNHTWARPGRSRLQPPSGIGKISRSGEELFRVKGGKVSFPLKSMGRFSGIPGPLFGGSLRPSSRGHHRRAQPVLWGEVSPTSPANGDPPPPPTRELPRRKEGPRRVAASPAGVRAITEFEGTREKGPRSELPQGRGLVGGRLHGGWAA